MRPILVVEDDPTIRTLIRDVLAEEGYEVIGVEDGARALSAIDEQHPSVVLLDLYLPNVNGWEVLKVLRQRGDTIPVVICSAVAPKELPRGVIGSLRKPFSLDALLAAVKPHVAVDPALASRDVARR